MHYSAAVSSMFKSPKNGFSLAELLIALWLLGVITTFTIPKIISASASQKFNAIAKEDIAAITTAYQQYKMNGGTINSGTTADAFLPNYLNAVRVSSSASDAMDTIPTSAGSSRVCSSSVCYYLANGSLISPSICQLGGTSSLNVFMFIIDPDGVYTGAKDSLIAYIYTTGRATTSATIEPGSLTAAGCGGMEMAE